MEAQRFRYKGDSRSAFVELVHGFMPTPKEFKAILENVQGVSHVEWKKSKADQGNLGNHYCQCNMMVYTSTHRPGSASSPIDFELTTNQHMKDPSVIKTVAAMFKGRPRERIPVAWSILLRATDGKQLFPVVVKSYWQDHVARWSNDEPGSAAGPSPPQSARMPEEPVSDSIS